jgi:hypothetical protein
MIGVLCINFIVPARGWVVEAFETLRGVRFQITVTAALTIITFTPVRLHRSNRRLPMMQSAVFLLFTAARSGQWRFRKTR